MALISMQVVIKVYLNPDTKRSDKRLFERILNWDSSIQFPQEQFDNVMRICFGDHCIVVFEFSR